jgi:uncharacterized protein YndB with AHSA1/START domain
MKTLHFTIDIAAPVRDVWHTMLDDRTYRIWTAAFMPGSYYEGSWEQGAKIRFLSPGGAGMVAQIAENRPHHFISIRHLGMIDGKGVEDTTSDAVREWAGAHENYSFTGLDDGKTRVAVDMDVGPDYETMMQDTWPKALAELKALCEKPLA